MAVRSSAASQPVPVHVPKLVTDPLASFSPCPVRVDVLGRTLTIPAMSASEWLHLLMDDDFQPDWVFPDLVEGGADLVNNALVDGGLDWEQTVRLGLDCVAAASGRPWWVAIRLVKTVQGSWDGIGGEYILCGIDPTRVSLAAWLDVSMIIIMRAIGEPEKVNQFLMRLEAPPPGEEVVIEPMDADQFMSMM